MQQLFSSPLTLGVPLPDKPCPHCERILRQIIHSTEGIGVCYTPAHETCDCPGSLTEREADEKCRQQDADQERAWHIESLLHESGITARYMTKNFENYEMPPGSRRLYGTALAYAERFEGIRDGMGLYLTGPRGVGKTHIAAAIAHQLLQREHRVICKTSIDLLADIRRTFADDREQSEFDLLENYLATELLIIDDLGKERITDWSLTMLYTLINMRYSGLKPMVITTNYTDEQLLRRFSRNGDSVTAEAIVSRLHEACHTVEATGEDYRKRERIQRGG